jgi:hypothetical protein
MEIPPSEYYPEDYFPQLLTEWPVDTDLVVPLESLPPSLLEGMGQSWRERKTYEKHLNDLTAEAESDV